MITANHDAGPRSARAIQENCMALALTKPARGLAVTWSAHAPCDFSHHVAVHVAVHFALCCASHLINPVSLLFVRLSCFLMPTAAELALQKKYAELRAKKQKVLHKGLLAETLLSIFSR
jgi:hypothetical protein